MTRTLWSKIGAEIRRLRLLASLTLEELAAKADVDFSQLSKIERGASSTSLEALERIARALGVPLTDLLPKRAAGGKISQST